MGGGDAGGRRAELLGSWRALAALSRVASVLVVVLVPLVLVLVVLLPLLSVLKEEESIMRLNTSKLGLGHMDQNENLNIVR